MTSRLLPLLLATGLLVRAAPAQPDDTTASGPEDAVRATIDALFDGMRTGDSSAVRVVFANNARLQTVLGPGDTIAVHNDLRQTVLVPFLPVRQWGKECLSLTVCH